MPIRMQPQATAQHDIFTGSHWRGQRQYPDNERKGRCPLDATLDQDAAGCTTYPSDNAPNEASPVVTRSTRKMKKTLHGQYSSDAP